MMWWTSYHSYTKNRLSLHHADFHGKYLLDSAYSSPNHHLLWLAAGAGLHNENIKALSISTDFIIHDCYHVCCRPDNHYAIYQHWSIDPWRDKGIRRNQANCYKIIDILIYEALGSCQRRTSIKAHENLCVSHSHLISINCAISFFTMLTNILTVAALCASALAHAEHEHQVPIAGPHKSLWYNTLPGDGGTQVRSTGGNLWELADRNQADSVFSGISTFGRLPYSPCLATDDVKYDIAFIGMFWFLPTFYCLEKSYAYWFVCRSSVWHRNFVPTGSSIRPIGN